MKKILIISYHSLPLDVIASYRANAYLKHLKNFGLEPTLLTHYKGMAEKNQFSVENNEFGTVVRVPIKKSLLGSITSPLQRVAIFNRISIFLLWLLGFLDARAEDIDSYYSLKRNCFQELDMNQFDVVMGIFSPHHHLRLCYEIHKKYGIPYILDFRDLWKNRIIHKRYSPNFVEKIQDSLSQFYWRKWLGKALFFSITSEAWRNKIAEFSSTKGILIANGYDAEDFEEVPSQQLHKFRIIYAGRLYSQQYLEVFLTGYQQFAATRKTVDFELLFYGSKRSGLPNQVSGFLFEPEKYVSGYVDKAFYSFEDRIPKKELIGILKGSQALLFPGMPASPGTHLGKIFDYLASHVNILLTPDDNDVVRDLIRKTKTGQIANTSEEVCHQLTKWYEEWQESGEVKWNGDKEEINKYCRESQVKKLAEHLKQIE